MPFFIPLANLLIQNVDSHGSSTIFTSTIESTEAQTNSIYFYTQMRLFLYVTVFWFTIIILSSNKRTISKLQNQLIDLLIKTIQSTHQIKKLFILKQKLLNILSLLDIRYLRKLFHDLNRLISTIYSFIGRPNSYKLAQMFQQIKHIFILFYNISQSISTYARQISLSMKRILILPITIKNTIIRCRAQIWQFWRVVEQMFQIIRFPIEILSLIGRFFKNVITFLHYLQRPRMPKIF